jgi:hypothetical protein
MREFPLMAALLLAGPVQAVAPRPAVPPLTDAQINETLEMGQELETRIDGDLDGDGDVDTVYVVASPDERTLHVSLAYRSEVDLGHETAGALRLPPDPLGGAGLSIRKGVLVVTDLTGGTTALQATYRYRLDRSGAEPRMRLIGLDATLYSRTWAHDGSEMSWNLLTGDMHTETLKLSGSGENAVYDRIFARKSKRPSKPVYMEDTPDPEDALIAATRAK